MTPQEANIEASYLKSFYELNEDQFEYLVVFFLNRGRIAVRQAIEGHIKEYGELNIAALFREIQNPIDIKPTAAELNRRREERENWEMQQRRDAEYKRLTMNLSPEEIEDLRIEALALESDPEIRELLKDLTPEKSNSIRQRIVRLLMRKGLPSKVSSGS